MIGYGDYVAVREDAPARFDPGRQGAVASLFLVEEIRYARSLDVKLHTKMIGIETEDGSLIEVPEEYVTLLA